MDCPELVLVLQHNKFVVLARLHGIMNKINCMETLNCAVISFHRKVQYMNDVCIYRM